MSLGSLNLKIDTHETGRNQNSMEKFPQVANLRPHYGSTQVFKKPAVFKPQKLKFMTKGTTENTLAPTLQSFGHKRSSTREKQSLGSFIEEYNILS